MVPVNVAGPESDKQDGNVPAVEAAHAEDQNESFQFGDVCPESKCSNANVLYTKDSTGAVAPVVSMNEAGPESGKQDGNVPAVEAAHAEDQNESFQFGDVCPESKCSNANVVYTKDSTGAVAPVVPMNETGPESGKQGGNGPAVEAVHVEDQNPTNPLDKTR